VAVALTSPDIILISWISSLTGPNEKDPDDTAAVDAVLAATDIFPRLV
jgi:hypothetical protein